MTWLLLISSGLACFRLTRLITDDKIFDWLRRAVVREAPQKLKKKAKQGITCPFCVSGYYSLAIALGFWWTGFYSWPWVTFWWPAIWGCSVLFNELFMFLMKNAE